MKHVFRYSLAALSFALIMAPAYAQQGTAPIRIGPGGSVYQTEPTADSQLARQSARITDLEEEISRLTGRLEEVEFRLREKEKAFERATEQNQAMTRQMADFNARITAMEESGKRTSDRPAFGSFDTPLPADNSASRSTSSTTATTGPRSLMGGADSSTPAGAPSTANNRVITTIPNSNTSASRPQGSLGTLPASQLPGDAGELFELGKTRLLSFDYPGAEAAFRGFLDSFAEDPQAGEAHYWLGEVLYMQSDFKGSASFLTSFVRDFPDSPRRADGVVKLARALTELGENEQACAFLGRINQMGKLNDRTTEAANVQRQRAQCS